MDSLRNLLLATLVVLAGPARAADGPRPNVVIFLADDAGWGDYGASGNALVRTPNIDSLARDGEPRGGVRRSASAPNCSYFVDWTNAAGHMVWNLEVRTAGDYEAVIDCTCPEADAGLEIELSFEGNRFLHERSQRWI